MAGKLEVCVSILKFLTQKGPQASDKIAESIKTKVDIVSECLGLLTEQRLLEKRTNHNNTGTYATTERSTRVLDFFHVKV